MIVASVSDEEWATADNQDHKGDCGGGGTGQISCQPTITWRNTSNGGGGYQNGRPNHRARSPSPLTRNSSSRIQQKMDREAYRDREVLSYNREASSSFRESPQKESFRDFHKESFRNSSHRDPYRETYRGGDRDTYNGISKDGCYRSSSRLAGRRVVSPLRNLSPIRVGAQRKVPPSLKHVSVHQAVRDRSQSPISPRERFQDARDKFLSLEREWRSGGLRTSHSNGNNAAVAVAVVDQPATVVLRRSKGSGHKKSTRRDNREELVWPKTDRDTGYGSRDGLLREKRAVRDYDRGYGTCDTRDSDHWKRELERRSPDFWDSKGPDRSLSPNQDNRNYRMPRARSPDRNELQRNEYQRAKSMHDLSRHRSMHEDDVKCDFRRRSLYDTLDSPHLQKSRSHQQQGHHYHSYGNLGTVKTPSPSSSSSGQSVQGYELPDQQRYPSLDRVTPRMDPVVTPRYFAGFTKRTFDYPLNGGHAPIQISRAHHDDYRRFRYDHNPPMFTRAACIPAAPY